MVKLTLLVALALLVAITWSDRAEAARRALVIGENVGLAVDAPLRFAEEDARGVASTLEAVGAVRREDVTLLTGASLAEVHAALHQLAARSQPDDELIVFFSGHGGADGAHVDGQVWTWTDVRADLASVPARLLVTFFDACFSGALLTPKGLVRESPLVVSFVPLGGRGRYLVTSSGANELSYESGLIQGSPFAEALRSGLRGAADVNGNGEVTLPELYGYIYRRTFSATVAGASGPQHPLESVQLDSAGEVVLVQLRRSATMPVHGAASLGRCYVLDRDGAAVVAALETPAEQVFVASNDYVVKCVTPDAVLVAHARLGASPMSLESLQYTREAPTAELAKGGGASESRFSIAVGGVSTEGAGALLVGYQGGSPDLIGSVAAGATWTGAVVVVGGAGMRVPWWRVGGTTLVLGLEAAATVQTTEVGVVLGGGSFVELETRPIASTTRAFVRLDLAAVHSVERGALEALLVGSIGVEIGR